MSRPLNKLSTRKVASLKEPGRHSDGGGLYLRITPAGARSWVFMTAVGGKRTEIGLGAERAIGLGAARKLADRLREAAALGHDPRQVLQPAIPVQRVPTFGEYADDYIASVETGWKNATHRQQWRNSLRAHAHSLRGKHLDEISTDDVLGVLRPIWQKTPETASRVRARIERVLDAAKAHGHVPLEIANPARMKGHLDHLLPRHSGMSRGHHKALPYQDIAVFMAELRKRDALAARCLEFTILTAARSGEALGAMWEEIDFNQNFWRVPAFRMKAGVEHIVPLSDAATSLLKAVQPDEVEPSGKVFGVKGIARSNMAMSMLLRRMNYGHVTVHGFRSTFRDWAGDCTSFPREIVEAALAHTIQNKAEKAYRRGTAVERRRELMQRWADFLGGPLATPAPPQH